MIADMPPALWFSYVYIHGTPSGHHGHVTQRVKLDNSRYKFDKLAHVTNYVFGEGYIACKYRSMVYWERPCGARVGEHVGLDQLLGSGEGLSEDRPLKLIIGELVSCCNFVVLLMPLILRLPYLELLLKVEVGTRSFEYSYIILLNN